MYLLLSEVIKRIYLRILIAGIIFSGLVFPLSGQLSQGGMPLEINASLKSSIPVIDIVSTPLEELLMTPDNHEAGRLKHLYFARNFKLQVDPQKDGLWTNHRNGWRIWQVGIRSKGAYSLGLIFSRFRLEGNARLFIYNEDRSNVLGAFTGLNNKTSGILPVSHLPGECVYIQLEVPWEQTGYGELVLGEVAHAYLPIFTDKINKDGRYGLSDTTCNIDINCPEGSDWQDIKRSVCRIYINGNKYCTGVLVNTTLQDAEPYILTAAHCIGSQEEADESVFVFSYESPECDGPDGSVNHSISGSSLIAVGDTMGDAGTEKAGNIGNDSLDFSLVKLSLTPPDSFNIFLAGWNRNNSPALNTVSIHHPHGDVKKISFDFDRPQSTYHEENYFEEYIKNSLWRILEWDLGTTEMGSSGAPLFDQEQRIVGFLTGGEANCASSVNDYYTKFDYSWDYYDSPLKHLKPWLDPLNTGVMVLNGKDLQNSTETFKPNRVKIYPNPGTGKYVIMMDVPYSDDITINVYSLAGKIVYSDIISYTGLYELNLNKHQPGLYLVRIILPDQIITQKIIHQP
jgi:lysyl endopeptidase